jgi:FAD/FMN-containing dehydrogenase
MVIDISNHNYVKLRRRTETGAVAIVGAGARLGNVYTELFEQGGYDFTAGTCHSVGIGGHISGGGYGLLSRYHGLAADNVLGMRVVLYNGTLIYASENKNSDLFWALRGGGSGSFGIVTQFNLKVFKTPEVTMFRLKYSSEITEQVLKQFMETMPSVDRRLTVQLEVYFNRVTLLGQFLGRKRELIEILNEAGMTTFEKGIESTLYDEDCNSLQAKAFQNIQRCDDVSILRVPAQMDKDEKIYYKFKSEYGLEKLSDKGIKVIAESISKCEDCGIQFEVLGGIFSEISTNQTPYFHRNAVYSIQIWAPMTKEDHSRDAYTFKWINQLEKNLKPFVSGQHYQNYPDLDIGENFGEAYFGLENFERLKKIKAIYDPENVFRNEQSIPLPDI